MQLNSSSTWPARQLLISQRLRQRRTDLRLTQLDVVTRLAGLGVQTSNRALSSLERGAGVDVAKLPELAAALECSVTYLIGLTSDPSRWDPDPARAPRARRARKAAPRHGGSGGARPAEPVESATASLIIGTEIPERALRLGSDVDGVR
jgi:transcriptional regulator with XRE-family HTH domain